MINEEPILYRNNNSNEDCSFISDDVLNIILSVDKDLLQICEFLNTIQCITSFKPTNEGRFQIQFDVYDNETIEISLKGFLGGREMRSND